MLVETTLAYYDAETITAPKFFLTRIHFQSLMGSGVPGPTFPVVPSPAAVASGSDPGSAITQCRPWEENTAWANLKRLRSATLIHVRLYPYWTKFYKTFYILNLLLLKI
jgi:hypothetical protein